MEGGLGKEDLEGEDGRRVVEGKGGERERQVVIPGRGFGGSKGNSGFL